MYTDNLLHLPALEYGRKSEATAIAQLAEQENILIKECGLFIDKYHPFLGATPDGLIGNDGLVEVKCPSSLAGQDIGSAAMQGKVKCLKMNKEQVICMNETHEYYYQVQGQLHITERQYCLFAIWTGTEKRIHVLRVDKNDTFWKLRMEPHLIKFYMNCMLPELVDPRFNRNMVIRDPEYIIEAQNKLKSKKSSHSNQLETK